MASEPVTLRSISGVSILASPDEDPSLFSANSSTFSAVVNTTATLGFSCVFSDGWVHPQCQELTGLFAITSSVPEALSVVAPGASSHQITLLGNYYTQLTLKVRFFSHNCAGCCGCVLCIHLHSHTRTHLGTWLYLVVLLFWLEGTALTPVDWGMRDVP